MSEPCFAAGPARLAAPHPYAPRARLLERLRILVVEDEVLIAMLLRQGLTAAGAAVLRSAPTLEAAIEAAETLDLDAAVLDINLRGRMSFPAAQVLARRGVPFVFVTGYAQDGVPAELREVPVVGKPYRMEELLEALGRVLGGGGAP